MNDFQTRSVVDGRRFEEAVEAVLRFAGWTIAERRAVVHGVEVDLIAHHPQTRDAWLIECKGSRDGRRPGLKRTDTVKKAIASAALLRHRGESRPFLLVTSHLPTSGRGLDDVADAIDAGWITEVAALPAALVPFTQEDE